MKRRDFLQRSAFTLGSIVSSASAAQPAITGNTTQCSFFLIGDTHLLADKLQPDLWNEASARCNRGLIQTMNRLPGSEITADAGGGSVQTPQGVVHVGDIVDTGDKSGPVHEAMQRTEWISYQQTYGFTGRDGLLRFPVMDLAGNHDAPRGKGYIMEQLTARNRTRTGLKALSKNGLHYSWDWNGVHFVALGLIVGTEKAVARKRRYAAMDSLDFLKEDLSAHTSPSQPIVLLHHVDLLRYAVEKPEVRMETWEWDPADIQAFHAVIKDRPAAIFYGHTHSRNCYRWGGGGTPAKDGIPVFNVDNSAHFHSRAQAFFYVEVCTGKRRVREYGTKDAWQSGFWSPQYWDVSFPG